jgi:hypothetical protein
MVHDTTDDRRPFRFIPDEAREHAKNAGEELRKTVAQLMPSVPPEFAKHGRAARKEMLLAIRSLIDSAIEQTEKAESKIP